MPFPWGVGHGTISSNRAVSTPGTKKKYPSGAAKLGAPIVRVMIWRPSLDERGALRDGAFVLGAVSRGDGEVDGEAAVVVGLVDEDHVVRVRPGQRECVGAVSTGPLTVSSSAPASVSVISAATLAVAATDCDAFSSASVSSGLRRCLTLDGEACGGLVLFDLALAADAGRGATGDERRARRSR